MSSLVSWRGDMGFRLSVVFWTVDHLSVCCQLGCFFGAVSIVEITKMKRHVSCIFLYFHGISSRMSSCYICCPTLAGRKTVWFGGAGLGSRCSPLGEVWFGVRWEWPYEVLLGSQDWWVDAVATAFVGHLLWKLGSLVKTTAGVAVWWQADNTHAQKWRNKKTWRVLAAGWSHLRGNVAKICMPHKWIVQWMVSGFPSYLQKREDKLIKHV